MPADWVETITIDSSYNPSPDPANVSKSHGIKFSPPSGGCTICSSQLFPSNGYLQISQETYVDLTRFNIGDNIGYDVVGYSQSCSSPKATTGHTIQVGSSMP
jgi:hypothetical protein